MANNKAIQILRGSRDYDPSEVNNELLDGQPFYSKKNEQIYVGDKSKVAETDANGNPTSYITRPAGASWIKPGEGNGSFISACLEDVNGSPYAADQLPEALGHESIAFGKENVASGDRSIVFGVDNESNKPCTLTAGSDNKNHGNASLVIGSQNTNTGSYSIISGNNNKNNACANSIISGLKNTYIKGSNSIILGSENNIGQQEGITSDNNIISGYDNTVIQSYNIINGKENYIAADNNIVSGYNNESIRNYSYLLGSNLQSTENDYKTALGYYNADLPNSLFEIGNGNSSSGKNAFSVNRDGDAFVQNRLTVGREDSGDQDASLFVADENGACLLNLTPKYTILKPTQSGYQFSMHGEVSSPEDDDFIIKNSTQNFVIARSGLLEDDRNQTNYRYAEFGSGDGLEQVSLGDQVVSTKLGYDGYTTIGNGTFRTFGIYSNASNGKYMQLGYWDSEKPIDNIYLTATDQFNFNLSGSDKFNISKTTVTSKVPFNSESSIKSNGSISVGADLLLKTTGVIKFQKYNQSGSQYEDKSTIRYDDSKNYLNISCDTNVDGQITCAEAPNSDTGVVRKKDLALGGSIIPEYSYNTHALAYWTLNNGSLWQGNSSRLPKEYYINDLNNATIVGTYYVYSNEAAQQILNMPCKYAGKLEVECTNHGAQNSNYSWSYLIQTYTTYDVQYTYRRLTYLDDATGQFKGWGDWIEIGAINALRDYDNSRGSIESRLTALGFKSGVITFAGTSYGSESYTSTENNGIYRQGNYVFCNIVISNKNIKLQENMFGLIPTSFRPKKDTYITVYAAKNALSSATVMASAIFKIKTTGQVERVTAVGDPLAEWAVYGLNYTYINFGYEAPPISTNSTDRVLYTRTGTMDGGRTRVVYVYFDTSSGKKPKYVYFNGINELVSDNTDSSYPGAYYISIYKDGSSEMPTYPAVGTLLNIIYE